MANIKKWNEKRFKDEADTAFAFQDFIQTFQNSAPASKTFIKSGIYNPGTASSENDQEFGKIYNPLFKLNSSDTQKKALECAQLIKENKYEKSKNVQKPKSNLEILKEEMRLRLAERGNRHKQSKDDNSSNISNVLGSLDITTNLFLTNLHPKLNEQDLMKIFGIYGPLASVKIMWPRPDERERNSNVGFVAYMSRKDSEKAYINLSDRDDMRITWGKAVEIPSQPIYIPPELVKLLLPPPYSNLPFNAQPLSKNYKQPEDLEELEKLLYNSVIKVTIPLDKKVLMLINRVVEFVVREGPLFEAMLMHKEIENPLFQFLFDNKTSTHTYYRWKMFSILHGESTSNWSTKPFRMFTGGSIWIPPNPPDFTKGMDFFRPPKNDHLFLSDMQQIRLIGFIRELTTNRRKLGELMVFCIDHADASKDVTNIIAESLMGAKTEPMKKIARLYLISDILFNSKNRKAPINSFVALFEDVLIKIFENLEKTYKGMSHLGDKDVFRCKVIKVLRIWDMWQVYKSDFIDKLEATMFHTNEEFCDHSDTDEPLDGKVLLARSVNCLPTNVVSQSEDTVTNIETEEEQMNQDVKEPDVSVSDNFIQSKWETLDPNEIEAQAMSSQKMYDMTLNQSPIKSIRKKRKPSIEREKLRDIEIKVMQYREDLENGRKRLKQIQNIEKEVEIFRQKCVDKMQSKLKKVDNVLSPISDKSLTPPHDPIEVHKKQHKRDKKERAKCKKHR